MGERTGADDRGVQPPRVPASVDHQGPLPPSAVKRLSQRLAKVPNTTVTIQNWETEPGQEFWRLVDFYVANGATITQIGDALHLSNFVGKYALQRERR